MGPLGSGDAMKAVNNTLLAMNILALGESLTALVKAGVNPRVAVETLNASSGRSFVSEALVPDSFKPLHFARLVGGEVTPEFVQRLRDLTSARGA